MNKLKCGLLFVFVVGFVLARQIALAQQAPATQPSAAPVFSEDFESGDLKAGIWEKRVSGEGTITVQQDVVAHGKNALKIHYVNTARAYTFAVATHLSDSLKGHFFGRAYVNFPTPIPPGHCAFISSGSEGFPTSNFFELGNRQNKMQPSFQQNGQNVARGEQMFTGPAYPVGRWFCLEWECNVKPDKMTIWIDGEKVAETDKGYKADSSEDFVKAFAEVGFGFRDWTNPPNPYDVYYDDIAFGTSRIGPVK